MQLFLNKMGIVAAVYCDFADSLDSLSKLHIQYSKKRKV